MVEEIKGISMDLISHPGETLKEVMDSKNMSIEQLSTKTEISIDYINQVIAGNADITEEFSDKLAKVLNLPSSFWNTLQINYNNLKKNLIGK